MKFGVGVLGATGFIGTPYRSEIREATDDARIVALCARRRNLLETAAKEDGAQFITDDWRQVVEHPEVNLVLVATPDALHHEAVMACAQHGKHLVCDKPIGMNALEAFEMWSAYRDSGLGHFVPFWTRYLKVFRRAREIVAEGTLGEIKVIYYRSHNPRPVGMPFTWRDNAELSASGSIGDVGSHAYDAVRWITGDEAKRVLAHGDVLTPPKPDLGEPNLDEALDWGRAHEPGGSAKLRKGTAFDYGNTLVEFQSGAVGSLVTSHAPFLRSGLAPDMELHGTEASLALHRLTNSLTLARPGEDSQPLETVPEVGPENRFAKYAFPGVRERAAGSSSEHPGLDDGWRVQMFVEAAATSAKRGSWVELAELEGAG